MVFSAPRPTSDTGSQQSLLCLLGAKHRNTSRGGNVVLVVVALSHRQAHSCISQHTRPAPRAQSDVRVSVGLVPWCRVRGGIHRPRGLLGPRTAVWPAARRSVVARVQPLEVQLALLVRLAVRARLLPGGGRAGSATRGTQHGGAMCAPVEVDPLPRDHGVPRLPRARLSARGPRRSEGAAAAPPRCRCRRCCRPRAPGTAARGSV